jgi:transposase
MEIATIGLDLAKSFFQVHGVDAAGAAVLRKTLRRSQVIPFFAKLSPCLVGMEACGTSHHWARELARLRASREADAAGLREALCEARQT